MKYMVLFAIMLFAAPAIAQDIEALLLDAQKQEIELKEPEALDIYKNILIIDSTHLKSLVKATELTLRIGARQADKAARERYFSEASKYAETALRNDPKQADAQYAKAAVAAAYALASKGKERVQYFREVRLRADSAVAIDPNHARSLYLLAKWNVDMSNMGSLEKTAAKLLYGGIPPSSMPEAIRYFEQARARDPFIVINQLDLAKAYVQVHKSDKAIEVLNKMIKLPNRTADDPALKAEGKKLLASLL